MAEGVCFTGLKQQTNLVYKDECFQARYLKCIKGSIKPNAPNPPERNKTQRKRRTRLVRAASWRCRKLLTLRSRFISQDDSFYS
jgi:hypothetical protein